MKKNLSSEFNSDGAQCLDGAHQTGFESSINVLKFLYNDKI